MDVSQKRCRNRRMKVIELFAGIGAPRMALKNLKIPHETIAISEIDNKSIEIYNTIHGETLNLGNITKIESLPYCDFLHASSPCQSFSASGKKTGTKGESGLIYEFYRLMQDYYNRNKLPKYISYENVPDLKTKFASDYTELINNLENWGYNVYDDILKAQYYNNPTRRERLFVIAIRKDCDSGTFKLPNSETITSLRIEDFLLKEVDKKYYWPHEVKFHPLTDVEEKIETTRKIGWLETKCGKETQSNRVWNKRGLCPTITCSAQFLIREEETGLYRKITEEEYWRLQGFSQEDFEKIRGKFSKSAITKAVGNSIALGPLEAIYHNLFN